MGESPSQPFQLSFNASLQAKAATLDSGCRTILDMDSTEVPVYGEQEQSAYNGYFESTCSSVAIQ